MPDVKEIFLAAVEKATPADRAAYLDEVCADHPAVRHRVEALLKAHDQPGGDPAGTSAEPSEPPGTIIAGRYKLIEEIGEGGMGTVWMAEQTEPVKRLVALKLVKPGMDSRAVLARFEAERQALAMMDHPNIARVFDGGTTEAARPFFVMELVRGVPITTHCDDRQLTVRQRLELFAQVCAAVQHAHQKGIIHRDLKPTNVLVTEHDGKPVPKVIDFGLAKALHAGPHALTEKTVYTAFGTVVGTPLYMAPEQVALNALDVDTRADVYALGVLLYELLTGSTPLERKRLAEAAWDEIRRLIREEEPPRPSTRLSTTEALPSIAARRQVDPTKLGKLIRGELDWIVMRALEKDRNRRYETANAFARDVQRYLADEPVEACPPSAWYRAKKSVRRYKGPVLAAGFVAIAVLAGTAGTTWGLVLANRERKLAEQQREEADQARAAEAEQRQLAVKQRDEANEQRGRALSAEAAVVESYGLSFEKDKRWAETQMALAQAIAIREKLEADLPGHRENTRQLGTDYAGCAGAIREQGKPAESLVWYGKAIETFERLIRTESQPQSPNAIALGFALSISLQGRAQARVQLGRFTEALPDWDRALDLFDMDDVQLGRALCLAQAGQAARAGAAADEFMAGNKTATAQQCYELARIYASAAARLPAADADRAGAKAVAALTKATMTSDPWGCSQLLHDPALAAIRGRADYADLLWALADQGN